MSLPDTPAGRSSTGRASIGSKGSSLPFSAQYSVAGAEDGRWRPGDMDITLEPEFYTAAFVSPLHLHQSRTGYERGCGEVFFTCGMLCVGLMQCLTVFGMSSYLNEKDRGYIDEFKLGTGLFTLGGATMSAGHAKDLCGSFNHMGLHEVSGVERLSMPDGTVYQGTPAMPVFHSYKMPSGSWSSQSIGKDDSYIDEQLRVVHDVDWRHTLSHASNFRVEYGVLLVIMVGWLWFHVLYEIRKILKFGAVLYHFQSKGLVSDTNETTEVDPDTGAMTIEYLTPNSFYVGCLSLLMRLTVATMMLIWGTSLLAASSNKLTLVLNSLAIGIVFELDVIIAYAVIDHNTMQRIESLEPVSVTTARQWFNYRYGCDLGISMFLFLAVFLGALFVRSYQVDHHEHQLHNAAALCLFAGPTPQARPDIMAPVPGFCESLLSLTCAPQVMGDGSRHGPCLITDQRVFNRDRSVMMYADDEALFEGMYDKHGKRQSMADWGKPSAKLLKTETWQDDKHLNLFRRVCAQMYQPEVQVDKRVVDLNLGMTMYSAPFYCSRDRLFQAVFGDVSKDFDAWSSKLDLRTDDIVAALDRCHEPLHTVATTKDAQQHMQVPSPSPPPISPAPAPEDAVSAFAPVPASSNLLKVARHRANHHAHHKVQHHKTHQEVYHHKVLRSPRPVEPVEFVELAEPVEPVKPVEPAEPAEPVDTVD